MTQKEILKIAKRKYPTILEFHLFSELFGKEVPINISIDENENIEIYESTLNALIEFQNLPNSEIENIENQIWNHCLGCYSSTKYSHDGGITWKESKLEDNLKKAGIIDKKDALSKSNLACIYIANDIGIKNRFFSIMIDIAWDTEHGMSLLYHNGKFDEIE